MSLSDHPRAVESKRGLVFWLSVSFGPALLPVIVSDSVRLSKRFTFSDAGAIVVVLLVYLFVVVLAARKIAVDPDALHIKDIASPTVVIPWKDVTYIDAGVGNTLFIGSPHPITRFGVHMSTYRNWRELEKAIIEAAWLSHSAMLITGTRNLGQPPYGVFTEQAEMRPD